MKITLKEYQDKALERLNPAIAKPNKESMRYVCMGLLEESGEIVAELRKPLFKGNFHEKSLDKKEITSELGDLMWYIALICKNNDINIEKIAKKEKEKEGSDREKIIDDCLKIGKTSGKIVKRYLQYKKGKIEKEDLEKPLKKQYKNIIKLSEELDISMEEILINNIIKVNSRYDKSGKANIKNKEGEER